MEDTWITKEEFENLPSFNSRDEAVRYFQDKYGEDFVLKSKEEYMVKQPIYYYTIVHNKEAYERKMEILKNRNYVEGKEYYYSDQPVVIYENGNVFINLFLD